MKIFLDMLLAVGILGGLGLLFGTMAMLSGYLSHISAKTKDKAERIMQK